MVPTIGTDGVNVPQRAEEAKGNIAIPNLPCRDTVRTLPRTTNIQVAGVDEPDIVKNDDKYIYTISGSTLAIIDAYPAAGASIISKTEISDYAKRPLC